MVAPDDFKNDAGRHYRRNFATSASSTHIAPRSSSVQATQRVQTVVQSASFSSLNTLTGPSEHFSQKSTTISGTIPRHPTLQNTHHLSLEHSYSHGAIPNLRLDENENETDYNSRLGMSRSYMDGLYVKTGENEERSSSPIFNNIEYGPGIVQKLREKFSQMSKLTVKEAQLSPHSRRKRFPSTESFLSDGEKTQAEVRQQNLLTSYNRRTGSNTEEHPSKTPSPQETRVSRIERPSRGSSESHTVYTLESKRPKIHDSNWVPRPRPIAFYGLQEPTIDRTTIEPISQLRAKFDRETMADRPRQIMLQSSYRSRSVSNTSPKHDREIIPEFISVGQKLRKSDSREQILSPVSQPTSSQFQSQESSANYQPMLSPTTAYHTHREESAPVRSPISEKTEEKSFPKSVDVQYEENKHLQRTKQNGTPLPAKYFGSEIKNQAIRPPPQKEFHPRPHSLPRDSNIDMPRPVRVLDLLSPPADPEPKGQFFIMPTPDRIVGLSNARNISPPLSTPGSADRSPPPEEPIQHPRTQTLEKNDEFIVNHDELALTNFEPPNDTHPHTPPMTDHNLYPPTKKIPPPTTLPVGRLAPASTQPQQQQHQQKPSIRIGLPGSTPLTSTPKISIVNDNSGIEEMQRLLNKFNARREHKILEESTKISPTVESKPTPAPPLPPKSILTSFSHHPPPPLPSKGLTLQNAIFLEPKRSPFGSLSTSPIPVAAVQPMTLSISVEDGKNREKKDDPSSGVGFSTTSSTTMSDATLSEMVSKRPAPPPPDNGSQNYNLTGPPLPPRTTVKPLPPPITTPPPDQISQLNGTRKSISSKFFETKRQQMQQNGAETSLNGELGYEKSELIMNQSEKPYGDDVIVSTDEEIPFSPTRAKHFEELIKQTQNPSPADAQIPTSNGNGIEEEEEMEGDGIMLISQKKSTAFDEESFLQLKSTPPISRSDFLRNATQADHDSDSDLEDDDHDTYSFNERISIREVSMLASDGNPVRHSLLNLVCEEDIPELLEAMAEECHFVFEDYSSDMASTSSIIHTPAKRTERRKQRNVNRIAFVNEPPKVFAYLDENSALEDGWIEGSPISYEDYQKILNYTQEQQAQQVSELTKWRQAMEQKYAEIEEVATNGATPSPNNSNRTSTPNDTSMGVTSRFTYGNLPTQCSQPIQIRTTADCGTSAI